MLPLNVRRYTILLLIATVFLVALPSEISASVELVRFTVGTDGERVRLEWETATEINNAYFQIRRSAGTNEVGEVVSVIDDDTGEEVEFILAKGDSLTGATYIVFDEDVEVGTTYYYKLEAIDVDGDSQYYDSAPRSITIEEPTATPTATPTPTATATEKPATNTPTATATATQKPDATATNTPRSTNTPAPTATTTRAPAASTTPPSGGANGGPTQTTQPSATRRSAQERASPTSSRTGTAQQSSPTATPAACSSASPSPTEIGAYPGPARVTVTPSSDVQTTAAPAPVVTPTSSADALDADAAADVRVPATIVQPPTGFDLLAFFGRVLGILIATVVVSLVVVAAWFIRIS